MGDLDKLNQALEQFRQDESEKIREGVSPEGKFERRPVELRFGEGGDAAPKNRFLQKINAINHLVSVLQELSPKQLAARGVPHTELLSIPGSIFFASVAINLFGLALPLVILQVYDRIVPNQAMETFSILIAALCAVVVLEAVMRIFRSYVISSSANRFSQVLSKILFARYLHSGDSHFRDEPQAKIFERFSAISKIAEFYGGQSRLMYVDLPFAFFFLAVMGLIGGPLAVVPCALLSLFGFATVLSSRALHRNLEAKEQHDTRAYDFVAETLSGIHTVKAHSFETFMMRRFERLQGTSARFNYKMIKQSLNGQSLAGLLGSGSMIAMVTTGAVLAVFDSMTVGVLACCSLLSGRAVQPILRVAGIWNEFQRARLAVDEVIELLEMPEVSELVAQREDPPAPEIKLENMRYTFGASGRGFEDLSFDVESGEIIAILGGEGQGKSTLIDLMSGLVKPEKGKILLDGQPAHDYRLAYEKAVGVLHPTTDVFVGSIYENISGFGEKASSEEVRWATETTGINREIDRLPEGYDTQLGKGIVETLPAGFIRRLLLTRALAQKPVVLFLDEAEYQLDANSLKAMISALESLRGWITIVLTTNQSELIDICDRAFVLATGELTEITIGQTDYESYALGDDEVLSA